MNHVSRWVVGLLMAAFGLLALYVASRTDDTVMYYTSILFFIATVLFNFWQIGQAVGRKSDD